MLDLSWARLELLTFVRWDYFWKEVAAGIAVGDKPDEPGGGSNAGRLSRN